MEHTYFENQSDAHLRTIGLEDTKREVVLGLTVIACVIALTLLKDPLIPSTGINCTHTTKKPVPE